MNSVDKVRQLFNIAAVQTNAAPDDAVFQTIKTAYTRAVQHKSAQREPRTWRFIMKSRSTKVAVAASVIVACVIGLSLWTGTQSGIALADVLARVEQVKTIRFKGTWTMDGQIAAGRPYRMEIPSTSVMSREYGYKIEYIDPNGGSVPGGGFYVSLQKKTHIQIAPEKKKYFRRALDDGYAQRFQKELELNIDPGAFLKNIMACKYESLGRSTIDSVDVEVFRTTDPNCRPPMGLQRFENAQVDVKVWVDVKTRLPVRYEDFSSALDQRGNTFSQRYVQHDFEWDIPVTAADFEPPPVPEGYTVVEGSGRNEETSIQRLRLCVELCGNYPDISDFIGLAGAITLSFEKSETPTAKKIKELPEEEQRSRLDSVVMAAKQLRYYYDELVQGGKDPAYYGKTVTPKEVDKVLMRWKVSDNEYRVIYGDLRAETVSPEKLAELEATQVKAAPAESTGLVGQQVQQQEAKTKSSSLLGTWEVVSYEYGDQKQITGPAKNRRHIKLITETHFLWVAFDTSTKAILNSAGGPCSLNGDTYIESADFATQAMRGLLGQKYVWTVRVEGDRHTLSGTAPDGLKLEEVWRRVK